MVIAMVMDGLVADDARRRGAARVGDDATIAMAIAMAMTSVPMARICIYDIYIRAVSVAQSII